MFSSERTFLTSVQDQNMQGRGRTQREDYLEDLNKMERRLKDEDPEPEPASTDLEKAAADLRRMKYEIAYVKLTILEAEHLLAKEKPDMSDVAVRDREVEIAEMRELHADVELSFQEKEAECEIALNSKPA